jgi:hypothetical protein
LGIFLISINYEAGVSPEQFMEEIDVTLQRANMMITVYCLDKGAFIWKTLKHQRNLSGYQQAGCSMS